MERNNTASRIGGDVISALVGLFMLVDGFGHALRFGPYLEGTVRVGFSPAFVMPLGIIALCCAILYLIPWTSVLGAILLTAYFGGAVVTMIRSGQSVYFPSLSRSLPGRAFICATSASAISFPFAGHAKICCSRRSPLKVVVNASYQIGF
jgi:hypothetical protein